MKFNYNSHGWEKLQPAIPFDLILIFFLRLRVSQCPTLRCKTPWAFFSYVTAFWCIFQHFTSLVLSDEIEFLPVFSYLINGLSGICVSSSGFTPLQSHHPDISCWYCFVKANEASPQSRNDVIPHRLTRGWSDRFGCSRKMLKIIICKCVWTCELKLLCWLFPLFQGYLSCITTVLDLDLSSRD